MTVVESGGAVSVSVSVDGLRKAFGARAVLDGVSLEAAAGSLTAILGASGSGKTTLLRLIAGFERADAGTIALGGRLVEGPRAFVPPERRRIGYVPQEGALFPHLSVADNVAFGLRAGRLGRDRGANEARVRELLSLTGLEGYERRLPHQLSGGERQRVALARALAARPSLVLLDEPFSSLDVELRTVMRREVVEVLRQAGATAILVTHDQDEALSIADRVAVLQRGTVVQCDEPAVLYLRPVNGEVARFVGHGNLLLGRLEHGVVHSVLGEISVDLGAPAPEPCAVGVLVRPEQIELADGDMPTPGERLPRGVVVSREFHGHDVLVGVRLDDPAWGQTPAHSRQGWEILVRLHGAEAPDPGRRVALRVRGTAAAWLTGGD
jgi:iron(III) transport system ATP-binding protein